MQVKFYKKLSRVLALTLFALISINETNAQSQGLYADTVKWPNTNAITVNLRTTGFNQVVIANGSLNWDKNSLQFVSVFFPYFALLHRKPLISPRSIA